jgi:hypothetical protein
MFRARSPPWCRPYTPASQAATFVGDALQGHEELEPMPRGRHIAHALHRHLPQDHPQLPIDIARRWLVGASPERQWVVRHALQNRANDAARLQEKLSLTDLSTWRHFPGVHRVEVLVNGRAIPLGSFTISGRPVPARTDRPHSTDALIP